MVLQIACEQILGRLKPYQMENPRGSWEDWVSLWRQPILSTIAGGSVGPVAPLVKGSVSQAFNLLPVCQPVGHPVCR